MKIIIKCEKEYDEIIDTNALPLRFRTLSPIRIVEAWQKQTIHYQVHNRMPSVIWKVAESNNIADCLVESTKF